MIFIFNKTYKSIKKCQLNRVVGKAIDCQENYAILNLSIQINNTKNKKSEFKKILQI